MRIGLLDIDGHNFPNLALMKISAYHKSLGDSVPQWQLDMARWVNKKSNLISCDFKEYKPRKNFRCDEYFKIRAIV